MATTNPKIEALIEQAKDRMKLEAKKRQVNWIDHHEEIALAGALIILEYFTQEPEKTDFSMDIYGGQVPNTGIDYNKRS
jgi:Mg-chelatase subunit ChlI